MQGKLIVFEGGEGSGKTSILKMLYDYLKNYSPLFYQLQQEGKATDVVTTMEPGGSSICKDIREVLLHKSKGRDTLLGDAIAREPLDDKAELLLYGADRAQHVTYTLKPLLEAGNLVLCDRFIYSTIAYQGYGRGLDLSLITQLNEIAAGGLDADLTIWLDVDPETGLKRFYQDKDYIPDRIESEKLEFHQRVRDGFEELWNSELDEHLKLVDANQSQRDVFRDVQHIVDEYLKHWYVR